jgi:hypothetical protein
MAYYARVRASAFNWQGWPDGKKFAFVLTHDVESSAGLANCRSLAQLEMELGFRSSFNFVPEGKYRVPAELRDELTARGFEVGYTTSGMTVTSFPHIAGSNAAPSELSAMHVNGEQRDLDRGSCCAISIGCMISTCNTMHPRSTRTHLSRSQTDVTRSFRSGCHAQMTIALLLYNQCVTALQEVTLSFPTLSRRIPHGGNLFDRIRDASG